MGPLEIPFILRCQEGYDLRVAGVGQVGAVLYVFTILVLAGSVIAAVVMWGTDLLLRIAFSRRDWSVLTRPDMVDDTGD